MRVAVTIWQGRISPVFDVCRQALVLSIERGAEQSRSIETLPGADAAAKVERLVTLGVRKLVCGAVSAPVQDELDRRGIEVIGFVAGEVDDVLRALMTGRLPHPALAMPGCGRRRRRIRGGHKPTAGGHH